MQHLSAVIDDTTSELLRQWPTLPWPRRFGSCESISIPRSAKATTAATLAPELFDVDDFGQAVLLVEGELPEELHGKARLAAANCPEYAIKIVEETRP